MTGQLERMRVFLSVAQQRSFAAAARRLQLSTSLVTRYVAELERELSAQLLVRTTRRVSLTRSGEAYAASASAILADVEAANLRAKQQQGALTGELRVGAPLSLGVRLLPPALARFRALHPGLRISLSLSDRFVDVVAEGFDMTLRVSGPPSDKSTIWRKICVAPRLLVAAPAYLRERRPPRTPRELADHVCIGYANLPTAGRWSFTHATSKKRQTVQPQLRLRLRQRRRRLRDGGAGAGNRAAAALHRRQPSGVGRSGSRAARLGRPGNLAHRLFPTLRGDAGPRRRRSQILSKAGSPRTRRCSPAARPAARQPRRTALNWRLFSLSARAQRAENQRSGLQIQASPSVTGRRARSSDNSAATRARPRPRLGGGDPIALWLQQHQAMEMQFCCWNARQH